MSRIRKDDGTLAAGIRAGERALAVRDISRRGFLGRVGGGCAAMAIAVAGCETAEIYATASGLKSDATFDLTTHPKLAKVTGMAKLNGDGATLVLVRKDDDTVLAFDSICPHGQCPMTPEHDGGLGVWEAKEQQLRCDCHDSRFNPDGTLDPASKPDDWKKQPEFVKVYAVDFDKATGKGTVKAG